MGIKTAPPRLRNIARRADLQRQVQSLPKQLPAPKAEREKPLDAFEETLADIRGFASSEAEARELAVGAFERPSMALVTPPVVLRSVENAFSFPRAYRGKALLEALQAHESISAETAIFALERLRFSRTSDIDAIREVFKRVELPLTRTQFDALFKAARSTVGMSWKHLGLQAAMLPVYLGTFSLAWVFMGDHWRVSAKPEHRNEVSGQIERWIGQVKD